jgi:uncharacterized membrane protein
MRHKLSFFNNATHQLWTFFFSGLLTILPLTLTIALFRFSWRLIKGWFEPIHAMLENTYIDSIPHIELIVVLAAIIAIGMFMHIFILRSLMHMIEGVIFRIPLVRPVYSGIKQLIHAFNPHDDSFKKVVLIQFPRNGSYSIGFITSVVPSYAQPERTKTYFHVFVPHTPNPTTGFLMLVAEEDIILIDLTRQEAMALIISGGIIKPERLK